MVDCNLVNTCMDSGIKLSKFENGEKKISLFFKSCVRSLRYLTCTRHYIFYVVEVLNRFTKTYTSPHMKAAKRILCYLKSIVNFRLFGDCNFAGDMNDKRALLILVLLWVTMLSHRGQESSLLLHFQYVNLSI